MKFFSRQTRRAISPTTRSVKLRIDLLEDRLTPSAFGPADGAYIVESWIGSYTDLKIQPTDQKIVAAGTMYTTQNNMVIARYDSLGNNDSTFGSNGITSSALGGSASGQGLTLQADGKAVVSGYWVAPGYGKHFVARVKSNGALDNTFGNGGYTTIDFDPSYLATSTMSNAVALQSTGKTVIASYENTSNTVDPAVVARFTTNGALDTGKSGYGTVVQKKAIGYSLGNFGGNFNIFSDLVVQPDDKVVTVGLSASDGSGGFLVARYSANGVLDTTFNGTGYTTFLPTGATSARSYAITMQGDGKIVTVGTCTGIDGSNDMLISRFNVNGTLDTSFGGGNGYVLLDIDGTTSQTLESGYDVVIQPDGKIVAVGKEYWVSGETYGPSRVLIARFNPNGTADTTFAPGGFKLVDPSPGHTFYGNQMGVALQSNGNIIVVGTDNDGTATHPMLMRFYGTTSPLNATSTPSTISSQTLTQAQIAPLLTEAIARWNAAGLNTSSLKNINLQITDLPGTTLGQAQGNTITLDSNAAGWGWFVDKTPRSDSEFRLRGNQGEQGRMDLLTVLIHETGHLLGRGHSDHGLMADTLAAGQRLSPSSATDAAFLLRELSQFSKSRRTDWLGATV